MSPSSRSSSASEDWTVQYLAGRYINPRKLEETLSWRWHDKYLVEVCDDSPPFPSLPESIPR